MPNENESHLLKYLRASNLAVWAEMRPETERQPRELNAELLGALKEALSAMEEEVSNRDGRDVFDLGCGNCEAGVPMAHSMGCRIRNAILRAEKAAQS